LAVRRRFRINPLTVVLLLVGLALLVVGVIFFVEPGHHIKRGLLAIVLGVGCGIAAFFLWRRTST
jgi:hypothetical protein